MVRSLPDSESSLGHLEQEVMVVMWSCEADISVREVTEKLARPLAYTTVMTTLDRLYKKGLLKRRKGDRAFLYSAKITHAEYQGRRAEGVIAYMMQGEASARNLLVSCLVDAVGQQDPAMLDELEAKIREKREQLQRSKEAGK
jgi:predicted transcriptional regulator